jgi:hypothetical protein
MYIVSNITSKREIRISNEKLDGKVIYKGHKLGLPDELLPQIIHHTHERYNSTFYFLDYKKWKQEYNMEKINSTMTKCWFTDTDSKKALMKSYKSLLETLKEQNGEFREIYIVEN